ncbi:MAG: hypothetical protein R3E66_14690 [bacterium]
MRNIDIDAVEKQLRRHIRKYSSTGVLTAIGLAARKHDDPTSAVHRDFQEKGIHWHPLVGASLASLSVQWSNAHRGTAPTVNQFFDLYNDVAHYVTLDPIVYDSKANDAFQTSFDAVFLRMAAQQFRYFRGGIFNLARARVLWGEAASRAEQRKDFPALSVDEYFENTVGGTLLDTLSVGFVLFAAASGENSSFTRDYVLRARTEELLSLPEDSVLERVLRFFSADRSEFRKLAESSRLRDRRFRMYDPNPLHLKPILRLGGRDGGPPGSEVLVAPIPALLATRISNGLLHQSVSNQDEPMMRAFGYIFEEYVGILLRACGLEEQILSERELRRFGYTGKCPDYVVIEGQSLVLLECKACRMPVSHLGNDDSARYFDEGLRQVRKALVQMREFIDAINHGYIKHPRLRVIQDIVPTVVTFETLFLMNHSPFHSRLDEDWSKDLPKWNCLSLDDLEEMQAHVFHSIGLGEAVNIYAVEGTHGGSQRLAGQTGLNHRDSYLAQIHTDLSDEIALSLPTGDLTASGPFPQALDRQSPET